MDRQQVKCGKCWQNDKVMGIHANVNSRNRLIMLHVGGILGFHPNAQHINKAGLPTGDYHQHKNMTNFEKHVAKKSIPEFPPLSVIVLDISPYYCLQVEKPL
jgi:hypothetical protein